MRKNIYAYYLLILTGLASLVSSQVQPRTEAYLPTDSAGGDLLDYNQLTLAALLDKIITEVNRFGTQYDDQTLMLIQCS
jgi:hypothetical protein